MHKKSLGTVFYNIISMLKVSKADDDFRNYYHLEVVVFCTACKISKRYILCNMIIFNASCVNN